MKKITRAILMLLAMSGTLQTAFACDPAYKLVGTSFETRFCYIVILPNCVFNCLRYANKPVTVKSYTNGCGDSYSTTTTTGPCTY